MHRFFISPEHWNPATLRLAGSEAHHAGDVLRMRVGEKLVLFNGRGREITAEPEQAPQTQIIDLMEALKASLAKSEKAAESAKPAKKEPAKRKKAG